MSFGAIRELLQHTLQQLLLSPKKEEPGVKLVVALGNIGPEYAMTRHNIGFMTADILARRWGMEGDWRKAERAFYLEKRVPEKVLLIKPTTYMNLSGDAVRDFAGFYHLQPEDVLVIQDDMDLPVGSLRIRKQGTSGGHNGLKSIEKALGSEHYPRIKVGIGHPLRVQEAVVSHVLHRFEGTDRETIAQILEKAADAVEDWMKGASINELRKYNQKSSGRKAHPAAAEAGLPLISLPKLVLFHAWSTGRRQDPPPAVSRRLAGRALPTFLMAMMHSSMGMQEPMPARAISAEVSDTTAAVSFTLRRNFILALRDNADSNSWLLA